jgi:hypothetical protein
VKSVSRGGRGKKVVGERKEREEGREKDEEKKKEKRKRRASVLLYRVSMIWLVR